MNTVEIAQAIIDEIITRWKIEKEIERRYKEISNLETLISRISQQIILIKHAFPAPFVWPLINSRVALRYLLKLLHHKLTSGEYNTIEMKFIMRKIYEEIIPLMGEISKRILYKETISLRDEKIIDEEIIPLMGEDLRKEYNLMKEVSRNKDEFYFLIDDLHLKLLSIRISKREAKKIIRILAVNKIMI